MSPREEVNVRIRGHGETTLQEKVNGKLSSCGVARVYQNHAPKSVLPNLSVPSLFIVPRLRAARMTSYKHTGQSRRRPTGARLFLCMLFYVSVMAC